MMDEDAIERWQHLATWGTARKTDMPAHLTDSERAAFLRCREHDLRIEQERLPQADVVAGIRKLLANHALSSSDTT
jgi:hypothetical protein